MDALQKIQDLILLPAEKVIFAAGFLFFIYGLVEFLWSIDEGGSQAEGKQHMLWGIIGILIMVSTVSIIAVIENTFGIGQSGGASTDVSRAPSPPNIFGR